MGERGKYGEPWAVRKSTGFDLVDLHGVWVSVFADTNEIAATDLAERARACVNAMTGIEDPAAFMDEVRGALERTADFAKHYALPKLRADTPRPPPQDREWEMTRALAILILLAGCAHAEPYYPGVDMSVHDGALVGWKAPVVVSFDTQAAVTERCERLDPPPPGSRALACATFGNGLCTVHIAAPLSHRDVLTYAKLHHELLHCKLGDWHD